MAGNDQEPGPVSLPDFSGKGNGAGAGGAGGVGDHVDHSTSGGSTSGAPGSQGPGGSPEPGSTSRRGLWIGLGIGGAAVLLVGALVVALVLSMTVFRPAPEPATATDDPVTQDGASDDGGGEYIPTEDPTEDPADGAGPTMTVAPSTDCQVYEVSTEQKQAEGELRGGGISVPLPEGWDRLGNGTASQPLMNDSAMAWTPIGAGWYATTSVGRVMYTEEEGGYPGAQAAARNVFECNVSTTDGVELYGDAPKVGNLSEETVSIDGYDGAMLTADVEIVESAGLAPTTHLHFIVIVLDTPNGPSVYIGGAPTDRDDRMADIQTMKDSITVTE